MRFRYLAAFAATALFGLPFASARAAKPPATPAWQAFEHNLRPGVLGPGQALPHWTLRERMKHYGVPGVAVAILHDGHVVYAGGFGVRVAGTRRKVDADTLFSVGSISKVVTAAITLRLASEGRLDIQRDIDDYLTSWHLPADPKFPHAAINLRMLMSHTSGLGVHGFADFAPGAALPTLTQTLDGQSPAKNRPVRLLYAPGTHMLYSGGGVTVEQQVIDDVTGQPFETVARQQVFAPLGMRRSTFANPLPSTHVNVAHAHDAHGRPVALPRGWQAFPQQAASGLWTDAHDLGRFVAALIRTYQGRASFLPRPVAIDMMTEVAPGWHGLGPRLGGAGATRFFHHGGANDSYRAWIEGHLASGNGLVVLTNGARGAALAQEIRNAVADTAHWHIDAPVRTVHLPSKGRRMDVFSGTYAVDDRVPMDMRQMLATLPGTQRLQVQLDRGHLTLGVPGRPGAPLLPLTPVRFVVPALPVPGATLQVRFHRDAWGRVCAFTLQAGPAHAFYRKTSGCKNAGS